jgi:hypothetical protein
MRTRVVKYLDYLEKNERKELVAKIHNINRITIVGADENTIKYNISSSILKYGVYFSENRDSKIFQMHVNSNMDLFSAKSFIIFDKMLSGEIETYDIIANIFTIKSSYERYQSTVELLDHFYDYTKFILMDLNLNVCNNNNNNNNTTQAEYNRKLKQDLILYRKQLALFIAYTVLEIIFRFSVRERYHNNTYQKTDEIIYNFCNNFLPLRSSIESFY